MIKIGLMRLESEGGDVVARALPYAVVELTRVPCVGEFVAGVGGTPDEGSWRVTKVVHLLSEGDGGVVAEVYATEDNRNLAGHPDES